MRILIALVLVMLAGISVGATGMFASGSSRAKPGPVGAITPVPPTGGSRSVNYEQPVPVNEAEFPLGMGCAKLDGKRTDALVARELSRRGIATLEGPAIVSFCEERDYDWILHVVIGNALMPNPGTPEECKVASQGANDPPACLPDAGSALARTAATRISLSLTAQDSEVLR